MPRFRKKPIVIDAVQWTGTPDSYEAVCALAKGKHIEPAAHGLIAIPTEEGTMNASIGDWIIKGVKGEIYPCKPDIFEATYVGCVDY